MKSIIKTLILSLILCIFVGVSCVQAYEDLDKKYNATRVTTYNLISLNNEIKKEKFDEFWTVENEGFLTNEELQYLHLLKEKVENKEILTFQEKNHIKSLKIKVIKIKLGEEKYKELETLIKKRESSTDLTLPERKRIYELNKESR